MKLFIQKVVQAFKRLFEPNDGVPARLQMQEARDRQTSAIASTQESMKNIASAGTRLEVMGLAHEGMDPLLVQALLKSGGEATIGQFDANHGVVPGNAFAKMGTQEDLAPPDYAVPVGYGVQQGIGGVDLPRPIAIHRVKELIETHQLSLKELGMEPHESEIPHRWDFQHQDGRRLRGFVLTQMVESHQSWFEPVDLVLPPGETYNAAEAVKRLRRVDSGRAQSWKGWFVSHEETARRIAEQDRLDAESLLARERLLDSMLDVSFLKDVCTSLNTWQDVIRDYVSLGLGIHGKGLWMGSSPLPRDRGGLLPFEPLTPAMFRYPGSLGLVGFTFRMPEIGIEDEYDMINVAELKVRIQRKGDNEVHVDLLLCCEIWHAAQFESNLDEHSGRMAWHQRTLELSELWNQVELSRWDASKLADEIVSFIVTGAQHPFNERKHLDLSSAFKPEGELAYLRVTSA